MRLDGYWGNGGMQAVVLSDAPANSWRLVAEAANAFRFYGAHEKARVLDELLVVAKVVEPKLRTALERDAPDKEFQALWDQIDVFDDRYDRADPEIDVYARIVKHAHEYPDEYVPKSFAKLDEKETDSALADSNHFYSPTAGFSITKPANWQFASLEQVAANRAVASLKDKGVETQIRQNTNAPLVAILKHPEPYDDLNPSVQAMVRPLGQLEGKSSLELMHLVIPTLQNAMADFTFEVPIQETTIGGMPAAFMKAKYIASNQEGRKFKTYSRLWVIPHGSFLFMISMSGPQQGPDVSEEEFDAMLHSIDFTN
jgi:hypothetical protein